MDWLKTAFQVETQGMGMIEITGQVQALIHEWLVQEGICFLFLPHTSASLVTCEAYDPSARQDVEQFYERLVPESQSWYRSTLTNSSLTIPIDGRKLSLGTWQGIFLFEHRARPHRRSLEIRCLKVS